MKNKNILEFCLSPDLGGLELFLVSCYDHFKTQTICKVIVAPGKKLDKYMQDSEKFYVRRSKLFPFFAALKLSKYIDKHDIDIIHFHWNKDMPIVVLGSILSSKRPKIVQSRHMVITRFKDDFYHKFLYKNITFIHAVTKEVQLQLKKYIPKSVIPKIETIHLGTDEIKVNESDLDVLKKKYVFDNEFVVGIIGRIEEGKGQHLLIEALSELKNLNIKILIVGSVMDEKYFNTLKNKIVKFNLEERVVFTGFTKNINEHMKLCDAIVLGTTAETFGLVVIEAMVNKVCIIATNKGGPLEIIDDGVDGLLFRRDSTQLSIKIKMLYNNKDLKDNIALSGYEKVKKVFNKSIQMQKLYNTISSI